MIRRCDNWRPVPPPETRIPNTCRTCGKEIVFLKTVNGKNIPVDAETVEVGDTDFEPGRHVTHFRTCPHAAEHRRAR